jgi:hypothetical protein
MIGNSNELDLEKVFPGLKKEMMNGIQFLDDMVFLFGKIENSDAVKIDK